MQISTFWSHRSTMAQQTIFSVSETCEKVSRFLSILVTLLKLGVPTESNLKLDSTTNYALQYKEILEYVVNFGTNSNNFHTIFYENLLRNPDIELKKVLDFCELREIYPLSKLIPPLNQTSEKWKEILSTNDVEKISKILTPTIKKFTLPYEF